MRGVGGGKGRRTDRQTRLGVSWEKAEQSRARTELGLLVLALGPLDALLPALLVLVQHPGFRWVCVMHQGDSGGGGEPPPEASEDTHAHRRIHTIKAHKQAPKAQNRHAPRLDELGELGVLDEARREGRDALVVGPAGPAVGPPPLERAGGAVVLDRLLWSFIYSCIGGLGYYVWGSVRIVCMFG